MKSYKVLDWWRVPKQGTIDHHEALRVLLFASDEFYFYFFMVVMAIGVDQMESCTVLELVVDGMQTLQYMKKFSINVKLSSQI